MGYIVVDFDGTVVTHEYPNMGKDIGSVPVLKELVANGHQLILFTMRSDMGVKSGKFKSGLADAVNWYKENDIPLFGIQTNPSQHEWTDSPKAYGQLIIDDAAAFAPLRLDLSYSSRPFIDWDKMRNELVKTGWIK
jgi:hypothetical protein